MGERPFSGRTASAVDLGVLRAAVFGVLAIHVFTEDLVSVARVPPELRVEMGVMRALHALPGWSQLYSSPTALAAVKAIACVSLLAAALGLHTRWMVPIATSLAIVVGGLLREQSHLFHTMLAALQLALVLSFMPAGDGLSIDAWMRARASTPPRSGSDYAACLRLAWTVLASVYLSAGSSKLVNGGLGWWRGENVDAIVRANTLNVMHFDWGLSHAFSTLPIAAYSIFGVATLATELLYPLVLFSKRARVVLPIMAILVHVGILVSQGILFLDLMVLQLAFLGVGVEPSAFEPPGLRWRFAGCLAVAVPAAIWLGGVEWYPFTSWQMYSRDVAKKPIDVWRMRATLADGREIAVRPDDYIGALTDCRYRDAFRRHTGGAATRALLRALFDRANELAPPRDRWVSVRVETWRRNPIDDSSARWSEEVWVDTIAEP